MTDLYELKPQLPPHQLCGPLQRIDCHVALRLKDAINLGTASVHQLREPGLAHPLTLHLLAELPRDHTGHSFRLGRFANTFFVEEVIKRKVGKTGAA